LTVLSQPKITAKNKLVAIASEQLIETNTELIKELRQVRQELGTRYGVPYSAPTPIIDNSSQW
jgi:hypothetical protein